MEWWQVLLIIIGGVVTWRVTATFNITQWLENRREHRKEALRVLCTHVTFDVDDNDDILYQSYLESPSGTAQAFCGRCGKVFPSGMVSMEHHVQTWINNPKGWAKREKQFQKKAKRLYRIR